MALNEALTVDANGRTIGLIEGRAPYGGEIASADEEVNQLRAGAGTNQVAKVSGASREVTFALTSIDTTNAVDFKGWVLEITESGYEQKVIIQSNTNANPGVATIAPTAGLQVDRFSVTLPATADVDYIVYPKLAAPLSIHFNAGAAGTLTIYRAATADLLNTLAVMAANDSQTFYVSDPSYLYYKFSVGTGDPEEFRWTEGAALNST